MAIVYKIQPTNTLSINRTAKKLLANIDRMPEIIAEIEPIPANHE